MICQDILAGRGTVVIDPHGDLVLDVLDRLPATVADRLVLFDPDQPHPPVLNPLDGDDHNLLVDNIVAIMGSHLRQSLGTADGRRHAGRVPDPAATRQRHAAAHPAAAQLAPSSAPR